MNLESWILFLIILDSWFLKTWNLKLLLNLSLDSWILWHHQNNLWRHCFHTFTECVIKKNENKVHILGCHHTHLGGCIFFSGQLHLRGLGSSMFCYFRAPQNDHPHWPINQALMWFCFIFILVLYCYSMISTNVTLHVVRVRSWRQQCACWRNQWGCIGCLISITKGWIYGPTNLLICQLLQV